ncbi:hypothetical protein LINPERHAP2_LOCUS2684, partial [Linum perenne]
MIYRHRVPSSLRPLTKSSSTVAPLLSLSSFDSHSPSPLTFILLSSLKSRLSFEERFH